MSDRDPNPFLLDDANLQDGQPTLDLTEAPESVHTFDMAPDSPDTSSQSTARGQRPRVVARGSRSRDQPLIARPTEDHGLSGEEADEGSEPTLIDLDRDRVLTSHAARPTRRQFHRGPFHRGRWLLASLVALAILAGVAFIVGEAEARRLANTRIGDALTQAFNTPATAQVEDSSLLYSLARKRIGEVRFHAPDALIKTPEREVKFLRIEGTGRNISNPTDMSTAIIGMLDGSAVVSWAEASALAGAELRPGPEGKVRLDRVVEIFGADLTVQVTARLTIDPITGKITLEDPSAKAARLPVPASLLRAALTEFADRLVLPELPGLRYRSLTATEEGMVVQISGTDVSVKELSER